MFNNQANLLTQTIEQNRYNSQARAVTTDQLQQLIQLDSENIPNHLLLPIALLILKIQGTQWSLQKIKQNSSNQLLDVAERKIRSLIFHSQDSFQTLLRDLRGEFRNSRSSVMSKDNSSESKDNSSESKDNSSESKDELLTEQLTSLSSVLESQKALLELLWENLTKEKQLELLELFGEKPNI